MATAASVRSLRCARSRRITLPPVIIPKRYICAASSRPVWWPEMEGHLNDRARGLRQWPLYLLCYLLWLGFGVVSVWTALQFREALLLLLPIIGPWVMGAVDKFGLLILGLVAIVWVFFIEDYLRSG